MDAMHDMLQGLVGDFAGADTWDKLDVPAAFKRQSEQAEAMSRARREKAVVIARPFQTPEGRACLRELLRHVVLRRLTLPIEGHTAEQQALEAQRRQGEDSMVAFLFQQIAIAEGQKPDNTDGGER